MIGRPEGARILIAGVGNIFLGDDAFGVEVAHRLARRPQPEGVHVVDFGIRGLDLAYALLDGYEAAIIVDALPRGGQPGTLYVLEPEKETASPWADEMPVMETHNLDPVRVLRLATAQGGTVKHLLVVGCEPESWGCEEEMPLEMSAAVRAAVDEAIPLVESLTRHLLHGEEVRPVVPAGL
jgi:hydrogenase maturation protease